MAKWRAEVIKTAYNRGYFEFEGPEEGEYEDADDAANELIEDENIIWYEFDDDGELEIVDVELISED